MAKWAALYPGQGSQYVGMGKELRDGSDTARRTFEEADDALGYRLSEIFLEGDARTLTRTEFTQPALLTVGVAAHRAFVERLGAEPDCAAGHSLGEWTALACAGAIGFADALRLVALRGKFMQEAADEGAGAMCAVLGIGREEVEDMCRRLSAPGAEVVVSNRNSPEQTVVSGRAEAVRRAAEELERLGARTAYLNVGAPFHSPLMEPAAAKLAEALGGFEFKEPRWPVLSNVTGEPHSGGSDGIARRLVEQIASPVRWDEAMRYLVRAGVPAAVELGPQTVLTRLAKANAKELEAYSFERPEQYPAIREGLAPLSERRSSGSSAREYGEAGAKDGTARKESAAVDSVHGDTANAGNARGFVVRCLTAAVATRNRNWDEAAYRSGAIEPYRGIEAIQEKLDAEERGPDPGEMKEALGLLIRIMETKGVPESERSERLREIVERTGTAALFPEWAGDGAKTGGEGHALRIG